MSKKRKDYLIWSDYFMALAKLSSLRSKDPDNQVGSCIVDPQHKVVSVGYNGFPVGCHDDDLPWGKDGEFLDTKFPYVCHAELNAVLNANTSLQNCIIYSTLFPCNECAKVIIQAGIKKVVFLPNNDKEKDYVKAAKIMFKMANVMCMPFRSKVSTITLNFEGVFK